MSPVATFFHENLVYVFFVYGLAFFVLGLAISLENRRIRELRLWASLWFLAAFGFTHSLVEWADMFLLIPCPVLGLDKDVYLPLFRTLMLPLSTAFLLHFGARLVTSTRPRFGWVIWAAPALFTLWAIYSAALLAQGGRDYTAWLQQSDIIARYLLYLPGSLLSAIGMALHVKVFRDMNFPDIASSCRGASYAFGFNTIVAGTVVPTATFFPASIVNYDNFIAVTQTPPQVFRAIAALAVAYFVVRVLRVFQIQQMRQLELAHQERFRAQQAALEMQRQAQAAAERWNRELEKKVHQRTEELEQRNRELQAINAITVGLASSFDLPQVLKETLDKMSQMLNVDISAIYLLDKESGALTLEVSRGVASESLDERLPAELLGIFDQHQYVTSDGATSIGPSDLRALIGNLGDPSYSSLIAPIRSKDGTQGVVLLARRRVVEFAQHEVNTVLTVCSQIAVVLDNARLFREIQRRQLAADALCKVGLEISSMLELNRILDSVVEKARLLLGTDVAALSLVGEDSHNTFLKATRSGDKMATRTTGSRVDSEIAARAMTSGQPVVVGDYREDGGLPLSAEEPSSASEFNSFLAVPLRIGDRVFGALYVGNRTGQTFAETDKALLCGLATQAAIAIENARLYDRIQNLAVLEERVRISREMHDGLAQILGYLNLETYSFEESLKSGTPDDILDGIRQMRKIVQEAYADVRESILNLRTSVSPDRGLIPTLEQYVREYSQASKVFTDLIVGDGVPERFPQAVEVQLVRIIQEALTNVRKHANATRAVVRFDAHDEATTIAIEDNGCGFDVSGVDGDGRHHFGLQSMRERTASIGGSFSIESVVGEGTRVLITLPREVEGGS